MAYTGLTPMFEGKRWPWGKPTFKIQTCTGVIIVSEGRISDALRLVMSMGWHVVAQQGSAIGVRGDVGCLASLQAFRHLFRWRMRDT